MTLCEVGSRSFFDETIKVVFREFACEPRCFVAFPVEHFDLILTRFSRQSVLDSKAPGTHRLRGSSAIDCDLARDA